MEKEIESFMDYLVKVKKSSENTLQSYKRDLKQFAEYMKEQNIEFKDIKEENIAEYIEYMKTKKKLSSVVRSVASIKGIFGYAAEMGRIKTNPSLGIKTEKVKKPEPAVLTPAEVEKLLEEPNPYIAKGARDKAMLELAYATGMRVTEIISLNLADIDFKNGIVRCRVGNKPRKIPIGRIALKAVKHYVEESRPYISRQLKTDALFVNLQGDRLTRQGFWKILKYYQEVINIDKPITPYSLRHSFASHLVSNGADLKSLQTMLGHSDVSSTQIYKKFRENEISQIYKNTHPRA